MLDLKSIRRLSGFGGVFYGDCYLFEPITEEEIAHVFSVAEATNRRIVLRGAGRSYGDASVAIEQIGLSLNKMKQVLKWDPASGQLEVESGITLAEICELVKPDGWWPPVVSGTALTTVAGAIAMNIHGKNDWRSGQFSDHVLWIDVISPTEGVRRLFPTDVDFPAFCGSFGLCGIVVRAGLKMMTIPSPFAEVKRQSCRTLEEHLAALQFLDFSSDSAVSWIDAFATGKALGKGIFERANYAEAAPMKPTKQMSKLVAKHGWRVLKLFQSPLGIKFLNFLRFASLLVTPKIAFVSLERYNFQLDYLYQWEKSYQPGGLIQFQSTLPHAAAAAAIKNQLEVCHREGIVPYLAVLKRHRKGTQPLYYTLDGYSLALDFAYLPVQQERIRRLYHQLAAITIKAGGRFYLAKDGLLTHEEFENSVTTEELQQLREWRDKFDKRRMLTSGLANRLGL